MGAEEGFEHGGGDAVEPGAEEVQEGFGPVGEARAVKEGEAFLRVAAGGEAECPDRIADAAGVGDERGEVGRRVCRGAGEEEARVGGGGEMPVGLAVEREKPVGGGAGDEDGVEMKLREGEGEGAGILFEEKIKALGGVVEMALAAVEQGPQGAAARESEIGAGGVMAEDGGGAAGGQ